jgi:uncharacterized protein (DUF2141 family)
VYTLNYFGSDIAYLCGNMRVLVALVVLVIFTSFQNKAQKSSEMFTVHIKNVKNEKGQLIIAIFDNETEFLEKPYMTIRTSAVSPELEVNFENLKYGTYAISIIHDENQNDKLDTNVFGIPKEGFGFSNDVMGTFGPPSFDKCKINWFGSTDAIAITLKYF